MDNVVFVSIHEVKSRAPHFINALGPEERRTFAHLSVPKRKFDWLAGRIASKLAAQAITGLPFCLLRVETEEDGLRKGQPSLKTPQSKLHLSITHSGDLAAAVVAKAPVGLDVETVEARPEIETLAFSADERSRWAQLHGAARYDEVTRAWCEKEAISKLKGVGFRAKFSELVTSEAVRAESTISEHLGVRYAVALATATRGTR